VFAVELVVDAPTELVFSLPVWLRGSYLLRDFAKHISGLSAARGGLAVPVTRLDKSRLSVPAGVGALTLRYRVYAFDASVRKAFLDTRRGFFNFSSLCYLPEGFEQAQFLVDLPRPEHAAASAWKVATALPAVTVDAAGFGRYSAQSYEHLIDSPVELADYQRLDFEAEGMAHSVALSGRSLPLDAARLAADLGKICAVQRRFFGGEPTMPRYWFLTQLTADGYGGLEHRESTALVCSRNDLPQPGEVGLTREYRTFLGLVSHEYFHTWNVKRITPHAFAESRLQAPAYTQDLWHYEGVTSYYDDLFLLRAGILDADSYLDVLAETATRLERTPARRVHSLADASFETWIKYYQPDEDSVNTSTNYYVKGALVALLLDLKLRAESSISLDTVLQALWQRYGRSDTPAPEGALAQVAAELSGLDLTSFFDACLHQTTELPLAAALERFGVRAERRAPVSERDAGGRVHGRAHKRSLGLKLQSDGRVAHVLRHSPAQQAGLAGGDQIISLAGLKVTGSNWQARLDALPADATAELLWFRGDELMRADVLPIAAAEDTWTFTRMAAENIDADSLARRSAWLGA